VRVCFSGFAAAAKAIVAQAKAHASKNRKTSFLIRQLPFASQQ
jgi:hypothetical protein